MRVIFMGTPESAVPSLKALISEGHEVLEVWTQPDRPYGRSCRLSPSPVKRLAEQHRIPVFQPSRLKTAETLAHFKSSHSDVAVVVAYGRILPGGYLDSPRHGCINVHFSLLPKLRGAAPVNWAIITGEQVTGVTTMKMDEGLDTGAILAQTETRIGEEETATELMSRLSVGGASLLTKTIRDLERLEPQAQDEAAATLAPILKKEDGFIDWKLPAINIERRVRGLQPWPTAFTFVNGRRLVVWKAKAAANEGGSKSLCPGEVLVAKGNSINVTAGEGSVLQIGELQLEGRRRMPAADFLNGGGILKGQILGG